MNSTYYKVRLYIAIRLLYNNCKQWNWGKYEKYWKGYGHGMINCWKSIYDQQRHIIIKYIILSEERALKSNLCQTSWINKLCY